MQMLQSTPVTLIGVPVTDVISLGRAEKYCLRQHIIACPANVSHDGRLRLQISLLSRHMAAMSCHLLSVRGETQGPRAKRRDIIGETRRTLNSWPL